MFDTSAMLKKYYRTYVVLSADVQNELRKKRKLNIKRLKDGLREYNEEFSTNYKVAEDRIQGSMAMHTVVQNSGNDFDIDVAVVFEKDAIGDKGPLAMRNLVANALRRKTKQFSAEPEVKTGCVRVKYADGYHVDFAVYRRYRENPWDTTYIYEHAGATWSLRSIDAVENWFANQIASYGDDLRKVVRLLKTFSHSRENWINMPSGIVQTALCVESYASQYTRFDEIFIYTMQNIVSRLEHNTSVSLPVDGGRLLTTRQSDTDEVINLRNRLKQTLQKLDALKKADCDIEKAKRAWSDFFNFDFDQVAADNTRSYQTASFRNTEQFIEDMYDVEELYDVTVDCKVEGNGFRLQPIDQYLAMTSVFRRFIPHGFSVKCSIASTTAPAYDKVLWKVRNVGHEAEMRDDIRGQIVERGSRISENAKFYGPHYIECYLLKDQRCIAIGHVEVPIGQE